MAPYFDASVTDSECGGSSAASPTSEVGSPMTDATSPMEGGFPSSPAAATAPSTAADGSSRPHHAATPIAVCGMALRLPGGLRTPNQFWDFLVAKGDARARVPASRYDVDAVYDKRGNKPGHVRTPHGYFLGEDVDLGAVDTTLFSMSRAELERVDPQQRILLEVAKECLESAGEAQYRGTDVGCWVGTFGEDWLERLCKDQMVGGAYTISGYGNFVLANRISYEFDLNGPSMTISTGCSSALVALHLACNALAVGDCSAALVCGSNLMLSPDTTAWIAELGVISPNGSCRTFDAAADGYARGEAVNAVYIKRLDDAIRDGNPIRAVIRGSASNSDGRTPGMGQPSSEAHAAMIRRAYQVAGISDGGKKKGGGGGVNEIKRTGYVECHGTGTLIGDPIEVAAVARVFGEDGDEGGVHIGSVKPNVGHSEGASGLTSLIKVVLALEHATIPPIIKFGTPNPRIPWEAAGLKVPLDPTPWPKGRRQRASVNSFGIGGANAHVVLESAGEFLAHRYARSRLPRHLLTLVGGGADIDDASVEGGVGSDCFTETAPTQHLLVFSANTPDSLRRMVEANHAHVKSLAPTATAADVNTMLADMSYTLGARRVLLPHRAFSIFSTSVTSSGMVETTPTITAPFIKAPPSAPDLVLVFTGQGAQHAAMGRRLMLDNAVFARSVRALDRVLQSLPAPPRWSLAEEFLRVGGESRAGQASVAQPLCTALQIALVDCLRAAGVATAEKGGGRGVSAVVGHSSGEMAAAYAAGRMGADEAITAAYYRGVASGMARREGAMAALGVGLESAEALLEDGVVVACENSPESVTISGDVDMVAKVVEKVKLERPDALARLLKVDRAYHSHHMRAVGPRYRALMGSRVRGDGGGGRRAGGAAKDGSDANAADADDVLFFSSVTGRLLERDAKVDAAYWQANLESRVRFRDAVSALVSHRRASSSSNGLYFLEVGPHGALAGPLRQTVASAPGETQWHYSSLLSRGRDAGETFLAAVGQLWQAGVFPPSAFAKLTNPTHGDGGSSPRRALPDLPAYPFEHGHSILFETRVTRAHRHRRFPRHELLGSKVPEASTEGCVSWRNVLDLSGGRVAAWVKDHVIAGDVVLPFAGYVGMVGEAARQVGLEGSGGGNGGGGFGGYRMKNVTVGTALVLHEARSVELVTSLRRKRLTDSLESKWWDFSVSSYNSASGGGAGMGTGSWVQHCHGQVCVLPETSSSADAVPPTDPIDGAKYPRLVDAAKLYGHFRDAGADYGPFFQALSSASFSPVSNAGRAAALYTLPPPDPDNPTEDLYAGLHPTQLDAALQLAIAARVRGVGWRLRRAYVPTFVGELEVTVSSFPAARQPPGQVQLEVSVGEEARNERAPIVGAGRALRNGRAVLAMKGFKLSPLDAAGSASSSPAASDPHGSSRLVWRPAADFEPLAALVRPNALQADTFPLLDRLTRLVVADMVDALGAAGITPASMEARDAAPHMRKFLAWLLAYAESDPPTPPCSATERAAAIDQLATQLAALPTSALSAPLLAVWAQAVALFRGEADALEILMRDGMLTRFYGYLDGCDVGGLIKTLAHNKPNLRVLEIGAGTGGTSALVLKALEEEGGREDALGRYRYASYTYTDVSAGFFPAARARFAAYPNVEFRTLDISASPASQGFGDDVEPFDLIVASNVLHATPSLVQSLRHVRGLLHPVDGRLFMEELHATTRGGKAVNVVMGGLKGWWAGCVDAGGDGREDEPYVAPEKWDAALQEAGYAPLGEGASGGYVLDCDEPNHFAAVYVARPARPVATKPLDVTVVMDPESRAIADAVSAALTSQGFSVALHDFSASPDAFPTAGDVLCVLDLVSPFFAESSFSAARFAAFQRLVVAPGRGVVWATRASSLGTCADPAFAHVVGAARCIRNELGAHLATVEVDALDEGAWRLLGRVAKAFVERRNAGAGGEDEMRPDYEYALLDGKVLVGRVEPMSIGDELAKPLEHGGDAAEEEGNPPLELAIGAFGRLNTLQWVARTEKTPLAADEVEIRPVAVGMNFKDVLIAMGVVEPNIGGLGTEAAGVVTKTGDDVDDLAVGDRVFVIIGGCFSTAVRVSAKLVVKIPDSLSFEDAASMPAVHATTIHSLLDVGRLEKGQSVLIHSACGGVGISAIQICRMVGASIFATVGSEDKAQHLMHEHGIPRDRIFHSRDASFLPALLKATGGRGVDLVLNSLSGELLHASWDCVAEFGKMVEIGKRDLIGNGSLALNVFERNRSYHGVDLGHVIKHRPLEARRLLERIVDLYSRGHIFPIRPIKTFPVASIEECFRYMQKGQHIGKIVVAMGSSDPSVSTPSPSTPSLSSPAPATSAPLLPPTGAYILVGGLGGLGRSVARWMAADCGAKRLVFLSRSAGASEADVALAAEFAALGCETIFVKGSVCDMADVRRAVAAASSLSDQGTSSFTLKGVINLSMVLRDQSFAKMTHAEWVTATQPKVRGTLNLHAATTSAGASLDFFVLFSSISAVVGTAGQSNYAAANSVLQAFVRYRRGLGFPASAVDVGVMTDEGYVARTRAAFDRFRHARWWAVRIPQLLDAVTLAMRPQTDLQTPGLLGTAHTNLDRQVPPSAHFALGLRTAAPLMDASVRVPWKRDRRFALYRTERAGDGSSSSTGAGKDDKSASSSAATLQAFVAAARTDPGKLAEGSGAAAFVGALVLRQLDALLLRSSGSGEGADEGAKRPVDLSLSLADAGLDSLVAIEMRAWWKASLGLDISVLEMLGMGSVAGLGEHAVRCLREKMAAEIEEKDEAGMGVGVVTIKDIVGTKVA